MAKATAKKQDESIIEPSVKIEGHENPFVKFMDKEPELKAIGYVQLPGTNTYCAYTIYLKGSTVTKIVCEEPNLKVIAEESAKISFVSNFVDAEVE